MKFYLAFLLSIMSLLCHGQSYLHDPTLDGINGNAANIDADVNGYLSQQLTISNVNNYGSNSYYQEVTIATDATATAASTYFPVESNGLTSVLGGTSFTNTFSTIPSGSNSPPVSSATIDLGYFNGKDYTIDLSKNSLPPSALPVANLIYLVFVAFIYLALFIASFRWLQESIYKSNNQKQIGGMNQLIWGFNAELPTAIIYTTIITAATATLFSGIVSRGFIHQSFSISQSLPSVIAQFPTLVGWDVITLFFPITDGLTALFNYYAFRYIYGYFLFSLVATIQRFLLR